MLVGGRVGVKLNMQPNNNCANGNDTSILRLATNIIKYKGDKKMSNMNENLKRVTSTTTAYPQTGSNHACPDVDMQQGNLAFYMHYIGLINNVQTLFKYKYVRCFPLKKPK